MELYDGKCVFLTGATGFLGKVTSEIITSTQKPKFDLICCHRL